MRFEDLSFPDGLLLFLAMPHLASQFRTPSDEIGWKIPSHGNGMILVFRCADHIWPRQWFKGRMFAPYVQSHFRFTSCDIALEFINGSKLCQKFDGWLLLTSLHCTSQHITAQSIPTPPPPIETAFRGAFQRASGEGWLGEREQGRLQMFSREDAHRYTEVSKNGAIP